MITKEEWKKILGKKELGRDEYNIYKSLTKYTYVKKSEINEYLEYANYKASRVVVEKNFEIIHKEEFDNVCIEDGDSIEVLMFMGGG